MFHVARFAQAIRRGRLRGLPLGQRFEAADPEADEQLVIPGALRDSTMYEPEVPRASIWLDTNASHVGETDEGACDLRPDARDCRAVHIRKGRKAGEVDGRGRALPRLHDREEADLRASRASARERAEGLTSAISRLTR